MNQKHDAPEGAKLRQWRGRSAMQWDSLIAELDAAAPTEAGGEGGKDAEG